MNLGHDLKVSPAKRPLRLVGFIALALASCRMGGSWEAPIRDCPKPAGTWIEALRQTWDPEHRNAVVTESGYVSVGSTYYVSLRFESLETYDGRDFPDATAGFGTDREPLAANLGRVWAASVMAWNLGLEYRPGEERRRDFDGAGTAYECLRGWNPGVGG